MPRLDTVPRALDWFRGDLCARHICGLKPACMALRLVHPITAIIA
jgi:hypothetical protein